MFKKLLALGAALLCSSSLWATDVNTATAAELTAIKGIGPAMTERIVTEREKAPFKDWDDFKTRVKGVGKKNAVKFSEAGLTVSGNAYQTAEHANHDKSRADKKEKPKKADKAEKTEKPAEAKK